MRYMKNVGNIGEQFAAEILTNSGYEIIGRNYMTKRGEIDIIALRDGVLHFIEVKTRTSDEYGSPAESVTRIKQQRMRRAAEQYIQGRRLFWRNVSFDVFEITANLIDNCI